MMISRIAVLTLLLFIFTAESQEICGGKKEIRDNIVPYAATPGGFCPYFLVKGLRRPRGIWVVENGDILVVESNISQVTVLFDENKNGIIENNEKKKLANATGLNHAVITHGEFLYASSPVTVYRWRYRPGMRDDLGRPQVVIKNMPCCHHSTRTMFFDRKGRFYVQSGSASNIDKNSTHARILRFNISSVPDGGIDWNNGTLFADGLRNSVALRADSRNELWGADNGADSLFREDLGGNIRETNPSEELNFFGSLDSEANSTKKAIAGFYGYPYCWSQYALNASTPRGTQYVHENFMKDGIHSDKWCRDKNNNNPPAYNFRPHMAPLDLLFWNSSDKSFPTNYRGAFISFHGSHTPSETLIPEGYRVDHITFIDNKPNSTYPLLQSNGTDPTSPQWPHRPVGLALWNRCPFGTCLLVTSDSSGVIMGVGFNSSAHLIK